MGRARVIRFFPDWGREEPLWEEGAYEYALRVSDLNISSDLKRGLLNYMTFWTEHFDVDTEWDSKLAEREFSDEGDRLISELKKQLHDGFVILDERDEYSRV
ncbi:hypothetical protein KACC15558_07430 [Brevibacterium ammoniilyticum]|uniref:Uncharacterized protein n=2 Tax=Brevibacterium ammoniilyticum TaxID=1046555 RepID=A0ABP9TX09_9MICO